MLASIYSQFGVGTIIDIVVALLVFLAIGFFFLRKKTLKLALIYFLFFAIYVAMIVVDDLIGVPIAAGVSKLMVFFLMVMIAVVYHNEIKAVFFTLSTITSKSENGENKFSDEELRSAVDEIIKACQNMSKARVGALIVIAPNDVPNHILETGTELGAKISSQLLESIFNTKAPFHDGAVMIKGGKILAAGCFLPLSQSQSVAKNLGTRHRAGIGITEETDMMTIIVSEETGVISIAKTGELHRFITSERLRDILHETFKISQTTHRRVGFNMSGRSNND